MGPTNTLNSDICLRALTLNGLEPRLRPYRSGRGCAKSAQAMGEVHISYTLLHASTVGMAARLHCWQAGLRRRARVARVEALEEVPCAAVPGGLVLPRLELRPVGLHALAARAQLRLKLICLAVYVRLRPPWCLFCYQTTPTTSSCKAAEHSVIADSAALEGKQGQVLVEHVVRPRMKAAGIPVLRQRPSQSGRGTALQASPIPPAPAAHRLQ